MVILQQDKTNCHSDETEENEAFTFVCNSFEEFIDGLQPEDT